MKAFSLPPRRARLALTLATLSLTALASLAPTTAEAHRAWLLPSATVLSGSGDLWVTVDAAVSNDLFYFEHQPMRLNNLKVYGPDGKTVAAENQATGRYRSTFDVKLTETGTYKIEVANDGMFASYRQNGETKRLRGTAESLRKELPAKAEDLSVTRNSSRLLTFVTVGKPTLTAVAPTGSGLELAPVSHPTDLIAGDEATFGFVLDGKPVADVPVTIIPGGIRYRDQLEEATVVTDTNGRFTFTWPAPGMYWISASYPVRAEGAPPPSGGTLDKPQQRYSYAVTVEVLAD